MVTPNTTLLCVLSREPVTINLNTSQMTLREVEEVLIEEEVLDDVVGLVGEKQDSKMTEDLSLNNKVGRILSHLIHSRLLIPNPQTLVLHFQTLVRHLHL